MFLMTKVLLLGAVATYFNNNEWMEDYVCQLSLNKSLLQRYDIVFCVFWVNEWVSEWVGFNVPINTL